MSSADQDFLNPPRVVIAMSGGVDSSVAAALLVQQGYNVIGMMLRLWSEPGREDSNRCCTPDAMAQARRVSAKLGIPFYAVDAQNLFREKVVSQFIEGYSHGVTPNPCLICNRQIRWEFLLNQALALGADFMATGHYARIKRDQSGTFSLLRSNDHNKDQSYVLSVLGQEQLSRSLFPLGELTKSQVRQLARDFSLPIAERAESQDLCFLAGENYRDFLLRQAPELEKPGPILDQNNRIIGMHHGLSFYTIGQRKGLNLPSSQPLYVLEKDNSHNALIVGTQDRRTQSLLVTSIVNWISGVPPEGPYRVQVKIRYKALDAWAVLTTDRFGSTKLNFDQPVSDITPGQAAVFYDGDICLGYGIIQSPK